MLNKKLIEYIKELSLNDKKNLTEKVTKLFEEGGELAKVILPFEGAYATNHRFIEKKKILEECADVFLTNLSILYSLNFSDKEFEDMVFEKAQFWQGLQIKEDRASSMSDKLPYEIHITIKIDKKFNIEKFKKDCKKIGVKPIILNLQNQNSDVIMKDIMTSSKIIGNNGEAFEEMNRISTSLISLGYNVIRNKIESSYWHPQAPFIADGNTKMPENCYFECHLNIFCTNEKLKTLSSIAKNTNCHLSSNIFKEFDDGTFTIMMTYRSYTQMYEEFEESLNWIKKCLFFEDFKIEKEIVEFAIYDTKINHDTLWLNSN